MGYCCVLTSKHMVALVLVSAFLVAQVVELQARPVPLASRSGESHRHLRGLKFLVDQPTILTYHNGTVLSSATDLMKVYLLWYGNFTDSQRSTILDFFSATVATNCSTPSVAGWWKMTAGYKDLNGIGVMPGVVVQAQLNDDTCTKGKNLVATDVEALVTNSLTTFPVEASSVYVVLTADDVFVEDFCNSQCGSHSATSASAATQNLQLPYGWVGNSGIQCPGKCAWPFAKAENGTGPDSTPLLPPNADTGVDGMIISLASILAGAATNPHNTGWYQGDSTAPLEAASACTGMFGPGSYAGYAGQLLSDSSSGVSFNAYGINSRKYLLPALWDPASSDCTPPTA